MRCRERLPGFQPVSSDKDHGIIFVWLAEIPFLTKRSSGGGQIAAHRTELKNEVITSILMSMNARG
jgi:hypothetical protein